MIVLKQTPYEVDWPGERRTMRCTTRPRIGPDDVS